MFLWHIRAARRAEHIAEMLLGVKAVVNMLHVETPTVPDDSLKSNVVNALLLNPATESFEIGVAVKNGKMMLSGNVQSWQEKYIAEEVSKGVSGVKKVNNKITVTLTEKRSDFEIRNDIQQRMANDVMIDDLLLLVEVQNARVFLSGKVGSLAEKKRAVRNAYVAGVNIVSYNKLRIDWWVRNKMMRKDFDVDRSDKEIEYAIKTAYLYDPRIITINPEK